jgi:hypothetical protein
MLMTAADYPDLAPDRFRFLYFSVPRPVVYSYIIGLNLLYVFVAAHTPITVYPGAPHDDTLFMTLGQHLAQGEWLGPYNQFTLMKGPGFPAFLALGYWLGIPASLSIALLHCLSITFLVVICHHFVRSFLLSGLLFTLLLWHPIALSVHLLRVFREPVYYSEVLLFLAAAVATLFVATRPRQRVAYAVICGLALGWLWLTREEGVWIIPGVALLVGAAGLHAFRARQLQSFGTAITIVILVFAATQGAFRAGNWWVYGSPVGVDFKETNFQRALRAIHSVRSGGIAPYISITPTARERVYAVSPAFASLKGYIEGVGQGWAKISCIVYKEHCEYIGVGFFIFAVRDAAASIGYYATPAKASAFFGQVADEIDGACTSGALECSPQLISEMPAVSWEQIWERLPTYFGPALNLLLFRDPPLHVAGSAGDEDTLAPLLRFLNYPLHEKSPNSSAGTYKLSGWYYKQGNDWFSPTVKQADGSFAMLGFGRVGSPDIQSITKDPAASHQRFTLQIRCNDDCMLQFEAQDGSKVEKKLAEFRQPLGFMIGSAQLHIDGTSVQPNPQYPEFRTEKLARSIREFVLKNYQFVFIPLLALGVIGFLTASLFHWKRALWNVCYILALVSFGFVCSRIGLLVVMGVTSNSPVILTPFYAAPVYYHLVSAVVFSIAAALQLFGRRNSRAGVGWRPISDGTALSSERQAATHSAA